MVDHFPHLLPNRLQSSVNISPRVLKIILFSSFQWSLSYLMPLLSYRPLQYSNQVPSLHSLLPHPGSHPLQHWTVTECKHDHMTPSLKSLLWLFIAYKISKLLSWPSFWLLLQTNYQQLPASNLKFQSYDRLLASSCFVFFSCTVPWVCNAISPHHKHICNTYASAHNACILFTCFLIFCGLGARWQWKCSLRLSSQVFSSRLPFLILLGWVRGSFPLWPEYPGLGLGLLCLLLCLLWLWSTW
jgi:hypothetical protein